MVLVEQYRRPKQVIKIGSILAESYNCLAEFGYNVTIFLFVCLSSLCEANRLKLESPHHAVFTWEYGNVLTLRGLLDIMTL